MMPAFKHCRHTWFFIGVLSMQLLAQASRAARSEPVHRHPPGAVATRDEHGKLSAGRGPRHGAEEDEDSFGKGAAIEATRQEGHAFRLSKEAEATIAVGFGTAREISKNLFEAPASALVEHQDRFAVFVRREGWFQMLPVELVSNDGKVIRLESHPLRSTDQLVTTGASLLRVAHLVATGQGGHGHSH